MKKTPSRIPREGSLSRYDWSKASRGRHAERFPRDAHAVVIDPEVWPQFGSAEAVNEALLALIRLRAVIASPVAAAPRPRRRRASAS